MPLGVVAGAHHNRWPDYVLRIFSVMGIAIAAFWFAIMLQLLFAMELGWLPLRGDLTATMPRRPRVTGFMLIDSLLAGRLDAFGDALRHLVLPARHALAGRPRDDRALHARRRARHAAEGFRHSTSAPWAFRRLRLIWIFVLRNSVVAAMTQIGLLFGGLIAGAVVVEAIFDWPGIGSYTVQAILTGDYQGDAGGDAAGRRHLCRSSISWSTSCTA